MVGQRPRGLAFLRVADVWFSVAAIVAKRLWHAVLNLFLASLLIHQEKVLSRLLPQCLTPKPFSFPSPNMYHLHVGFFARVQMKAHLVDAIIVCATLSVARWDDE